MSNFDNTINIIPLKKTNNINKNIILFIIISIFIYIIATAYSIYSFSRVDELTDADAAVVLGASAWNGRPSPVFRERINHGIWLYKNGYVKHLIFTGGFGKNDDGSESAAAMAFAIGNSVPEEDIFIEEMSNVTLENLFYAKDIIKENNFNKIILVSDPMHMKRAVAMAKDFGLNVYSSPTTTTRYISLKTKLPFLFYELFFYISYTLYKYSFVIFLYMLLFELLFIKYRRLIPEKTLSSPLFHNFIQRRGRSCPKYDHNGGKNHR